MFDSKEYWENLGYKVLEGNFQEKDQMVINRPKENSLQVISDHFTKNDIIKYEVFDSFPDEIEFVTSSI
ncbi:MAG TPA: hypothetical protein DEF78_22690, partial [Sphingobacterium sp.]|nr:hypothetical protein [Sphingobacterium sp.]